MADYRQIHDTSAGPHEKGTCEACDKESGSKVVAYDPAEQDEIIEAFIELLTSSTLDGANKRMRGEKPGWKIDPDHLAAKRRHDARYELDPAGKDKDSGAHHLVASAWRSLAIAWQDTHPEEVRQAWRASGLGA